VFVGDNVKWDVDGAQKVGMTPVLIDRSGQTRESVVPKIASLFELDALLRSLWDGTSLLTFLRNTPLPKAILCDLDDTILGDSENADACWQRICARYALRIEGLTPETLLTAIDASRRWFWGDPERHRRGRLHLEQARREIVTGALRWLGIEAPVVANEIADAYTVERAGTVQPVPGAIETLRSLRDQGVRLALITNGSTEVQRGKIERFGLVSLFDCILIEGEFGVGKPDPRVYRHTLDQLNVSPEETWMVGDNVEWDVAAPQRLGIVGIWLDIAGSGLPASSPVRPDRIIRTLSDLLEGTVEWTRAPLRTSSKDKGT
jgi:putative hydrolase of the HAD superfamily